MTVSSMKRQSIPEAPMSDAERPEIDQVIMGRRSPDGSTVTFDVKISHIIEQTLLKTYKSPKFKKLTIKVVEEGDDIPDSADINSRNEETQVQKLFSTPESSNETLAQGTPDAPQVCSDSTEGSTFSVSSLLQQSSNKDKDLESIFKSINPIPPSWIEKGLSQKDHKRIQRSMDNASLCPYEHKYKKSRRLSKPYLRPWRAN